MARYPRGFFTISAIFRVHWNEYQPASRERVVPAEWQVRTVLGDCIARAKVTPAPAPQYRQHAQVSDSLDLAHLSLQDEAALATNWIKVRPEETGPSYRQFTGKSNRRRPLRNQQMRIFGLRETFGPSRESTSNCMGFCPVYGSPSTSLFADCAFTVLHFASGHPRLRF